MQFSSAFIILVKLCVHVLTKAVNKYHATFAIMSFM